MRPFVPKDINQQYVELSRVVDTITDDF